MTTLLDSRSDTPLYTENSVRRYPCCICGRPLNPFPNRRHIPDYFCQVCFVEFDIENIWNTAPWVKYLQNQERSRRLKVQRRINAGIPLEDWSLDYMHEVHGETAEESEGSCD